MKTDRRAAGNFSYLLSAAAVVSSWHLSARAAFRLERKSPAIRPCVYLLMLAANGKKYTIKAMNKST